MRIAIIKDYNENHLPVWAASPRSWAHILALDNISGNFVVALSICTVRKMPYPKEKWHRFYFPSVKQRQCRFQANMTRPASSQIGHTQENARRMHCDTLCSFGLCPSCAQLMNVKGKSNQWTSVEDFLHFAVQEYTALLHCFYKQNYVFGKCL